MLKKNHIFAIFLLCLPACSMCSEKQKDKLLKVMTKKIEANKKELERTESPVSFEEITFCTGRTIKFSYKENTETENHDNGCLF